MPVVLRQGESKDIATIYNFILELAEYEKLSDAVTCTQEILYDSLFVRKEAQVVLAENDGVAVGFCLFFYNFSTFVGKKGLYLEDIYIVPKCRNKGIGKQFFHYLAKTAVNEGCTRFEWSVLDWNKSAIDFYNSVGAVAMDEWTVHRLMGDNLVKLATAVEK